MDNSERQPTIGAAVRWVLLTEATLIPAALLSSAFWIPTLAEQQYDLVANYAFTVAITLGVLWIPSLVYVAVLLAAAYRRPQIFRVSKFILSPVVVVPAIWNSVIAPGTGWFAWVLGIGIGLTYALLVRDPDLVSAARDN